MFCLKLKHGERTEAEKAVKTLRCHDLCLCSRFSRSLFWRFRHLWLFLFLASLLTRLFLLLTLDTYLQTASLWNLFVDFASCFSGLCFECDFLDFDIWGGLDFGLLKRIGIGFFQGEWIPGFGNCFWCCVVCSVLVLPFPVLPPSNYAALRPCGERRPQRLPCCSDPTSSAIIDTLNSCKQTSARKEALTCSFLFENQYLDSLPLISCVTVLLNAIFRPGGQNLTEYPAATSPALLSLYSTSSFIKTS